jgi:hypothetical protein
MSVLRKVIGWALVDLHHKETTTNDKWLSLEATFMASLPDFAFERLDLEHLANELGCLVRLTAKYHCKIAGEGVENRWADSQRRSTVACPLQRSVSRCLHQICRKLSDSSYIPEQARRFFRGAAAGTCWPTTSPQIRLMAKAPQLPHLNGSKRSLTPALLQQPYPARKSRR